MHTMRAFWGGGVVAIALAFVIGARPVSWAAEVDATAPAGTAAVHGHSGAGQERERIDALLEEVRRELAALRQERAALAQERDELRAAVTALLAERAPGAGPSGRLPLAAGPAPAALPDVMAQRGDRGLASTPGEASDPADRAPGAAPLAPAQAAGTASALAAGGGRVEVSADGNVILSPAADKRLVAPGIHATFGQPGASADNNVFHRYETYRNVAPFALTIGGDPHNGVFDDVMYWGYNARNGNAKIVEGAPRLAHSLEADFFDGKQHGMEWNLDYANPSGTKTTRPLAFYVERENMANMYWWFRIGDEGDSKFVVTSPDEKEYFRITQGGWIEADPVGRNNFLGPGRVAPGEPVPVLTLSSKNQEPTLALYNHLSGVWGRIGTQENSIRFSVNSPATSYAFTGGRVEVERGLTVSGDGLAVRAGSVVLADGRNVVLGMASGTTLGTTPSQKLAFFGATPVTQQPALSPADGSAVDASYGPEEASVIENLRTRVNELEARLQTYGLLGGGRTPAEASPAPRPEIAIVARFFLPFIARGP